MQNSLYLTDTIKEVDNLPCSHPASVNLDVANFYHNLTTMIRPLLVVEIGCFIGFSTLHFAEALRRQGFGKIISIDAFDWDVDNGQGPQSRHQIALHYRQKANLDKVITYIKGYSSDVYPQVEQSIQNSIDLLYIDGDHSINGVYQDFNTYYGDVKVGGYILLHDIYPEMCGEYGPRVLIDHLKSSRLIPKALNVIELPTRDGFGVALLRKESNAPVHLTPPTGKKSVTFLKRVINKLAREFNKGKGIQQAINAQFIINITVINSVNKQPIPEVTLLCPQRWDEAFITDNNGEVQINHYLPNRYLFNITANNYAPLDNYLINVTSGAKKQHYIIELSPNN